jgi:hypothetical protein
MVVKLGLLSVAGLIALTGSCASCEEPTPLPPIVIDAHAHIFNLDDLPKEGFLRQALGLPSWLASLLLAIIELIPTDARALEDPRVTEAEVDEALRRLYAQPIASRSIEADDAQDVNIVLKALVEGREALTTAELQRLEELEQQPIESAESSALARARGARFLESVRGHVRWVLLLKRTTPAVAKSMQLEMPGVQLFTPFMMDMRAWFPPPLPARSMRQQYESAREVTRDSRGTIHPFVAFDPKRNLDDPGDSMALVKEALLQGFIGVKLYPPMGYRPVGNAELPGGDGRWDQELECLFDYCAAPERDIPIAVHCSDPGAESKPGYGKRADPVHWGPVLNAYKERGTPLRVCFLHFGGLSDLVDRGEESWAWTVAGLMQNHERVYADLGHAEELLDEKGRAQAARALHALFAAHPSARERLCFGTDWHMVMRAATGSAYLTGHQRFIDEYFPAMRASYFGGSALAYLGVLPGGRTRERLLQFYQMNSIALPGWWPE